MVVAFPIEADLQHARDVRPIGSTASMARLEALISNAFTDRVEPAKAIGLWGATTRVAIANEPIAGESRWSISLGTAPSSP
jgi:hypothetical protein